MKKYKILWVSRHYPKKEQINWLKRHFKKDIEIVQYKETINTPEEIDDLMKNNKCDDLMIIAQPSVLSGVLKMGYKPLKSYMKRIIVDPETGQTNYNFIKFVRYSKFDVDIEDL